MSARVTVHFGCDAPGCARRLPVDLPLWQWPHGPSSADINEAMAAADWGPPVVSGAPIGGTHYYCPEHYHTPLP